MANKEQVKKDANQWLSGEPRETLRKLRHDILGYVALVDGTADLLLEDLSESDVDAQLLEMLHHIMDKAHHVRHELNVLIEYAHHIQVDEAD